MVKKRFPMFFLALLITTSLFFGCQGNRNGEAAQRQSAPDSNQAAEVNEAGEGLRIVFVTSPNVAQDGAFNENNYNGVVAFIENNPQSSVTLVHDLDINRALEAVSGAVMGYDVIVTPGFQFSRIARIAIDHPDKRFILTDTFPSDGSGTVVLDNIFAVQFREQDGGFLAGVAAALESNTGRIASIGGMATNPANVNYQYGFEAGMHYANRHLGTNVSLISIPAYAGVDANGVNVGGSYVGSFNDDSLCGLLANSLFDEGVDIIFVFAGNASRGAFVAAMERDNVFIIGAGTDQFTLGLRNGRNVDLTSIIKAMGLNVMRALEAIYDGSFRGGNYRLGIDTDSIVYINAPGRHQLSPDTIRALEALKPLMKSGEIVPPSTFNNTLPNNFQGL